MAIALHRNHLSILSLTFFFWQLLLLKASKKDIGKK
jgi:hypothetical protein